MGRTPSPTQYVRSLADAAGLSTETTDLAVDMTRTATRSPEMAGRLPKAVAAGSLYTAALAVGSGRNGGLRFEQSFRSASPSSGPRNGPSSPGLKRNRQIGHRRTDHGSTELSICQFASITPASLRKHAREVAAIYLESDTGNASPQIRQRLGRLALRR